MMRLQDNHDSCHICCIRVDDNLLSPGRKLLVFVNSIPENIKYNYLHIFFAQTSYAKYLPKRIYPKKINFCCRCSKRFWPSFDGEHSHGLVYDRHLVEILAEMVLIAKSSEISILLPTREEKGNSLIEVLENLTQTVNG